MRDKLRTSLTHGLLIVNALCSWLKHAISPPLRAFTAWEAWRRASGGGEKKKNTCQIAATTEDLTFKMSHTKPLLMPGEVENLRRRSTADPTGELNLFQLVSFVPVMQSHVLGPCSKFGVSVWLQTTHLYAWIYKVSVYSKQCNKYTIQVCGLFKTRN